MLAFREQATLLLILCLELTKVRDRIDLTMTKAKSSPYTYKHDSTLQGITHHGQIECCFMQHCRVYLSITKQKNVKKSILLKIGRKASSQVNDLVIALPRAPRDKWKIIRLLTAIDLPGAGQV